MQSNNENGISRRYTILMDRCLTNSRSKEEDELKIRDDRSLSVLGCWLLVSEWPGGEWEGHRGWQGGEMFRHKIFLAVG